MESPFSGKQLSNQPQFLNRRNAEPELSDNLISPDIADVFKAAVLRGICIVSDHKIFLLRQGDGILRNPGKCDIGDFRCLQFLSVDENLLVLNQDGFSRQTDDTLDIDSTVIAIKGYDIKSARRDNMIDHQVCKHHVIGGQGRFHTVSAHDRLGQKCVYQKPRKGDQYDDIDQGTKRFLEEFSFIHSVYFTIEQGKANINLRRP